MRDAQCECDFKMNQQTIIRLPEDWSDIPPADRMVFETSLGYKPCLLLSPDGRTLVRVLNWSGVLTFPESVTKVADGAASTESPRIGVVMWGKTLKQIGRDAFPDVESSSVVLPPTVEYVGQDAFDGNYFLASENCRCDDDPDNDGIVPRYQDYGEYLRLSAITNQICGAKGDIHELLENVRDMLNNIRYRGERRDVIKIVSKHGSRIGEMLTAENFMKCRTEDDQQLFNDLFCADWPVLERKDDNGCPRREMFYRQMIFNPSIPRTDRTEFARGIASYRFGTIENRTLFELFTTADLHYQKDDEDLRLDNNLWANGLPTLNRSLRDNQLLAAIRDDAKTRFLMLLDIKGITVRKTVFAHLIERRAVKCLTALYLRYPEKKLPLPLNILFLHACSLWSWIDIHRLIDAVEREMPGRCKTFRDGSGHSALWYLLLRGDRNRSCHAYFKDFILGAINSRTVKKLVEAGVDPFEEGACGLTWFEVTVGEEGLNRFPFLDSRIWLVTILRKRMTDLTPDECP